MQTEPRSLRVASSDAGRRVDVLLAEGLALSRAQVRRLLQRGVVRLDGRRLSERAKGERVEAGATFEVDPFRPRQAQHAIVEPESPLAVLAEGPGWLAVDKPAGVPVHPLEEQETGTILGAALARHPEIFGVGEGGLRSGVVHRLDVDTSGVLLLATREESWQRLRAAFAAQRVAKTYRALVAGRLEEDGGASVDLVVARHRPARVRVVEEGERGRARGARRGEIHVRPLALGEDTTLVEVAPRGGFLHQIRVTLAYLGFPVLGDRVYASDRVAARAPRQMLHAARLAYEEIHAESPDPADFAALRDALLAEPARAATPGDPP